MKVFNQGGRLFTYLELNLPPGQFTTVPEKHEAGVRKLLEKYPTELVTGDSAEKTMKNAGQKLKEKDAEIARQQAQITKLQKMLVEGGDDEAIKRAEAAEEKVATLDADLRSTTNRLQEVEGLIATRNDRIAALEAIVAARDAVPEAPPAEVPSTEPAAPDAQG